MSQSAESQRENREYYKNLKRCVRCHEKDAYTLIGRSYCFSCTQKEKEYGRIRYQNGKESRTKRVSELQSARVANGLCPRCGRPQDKQGRKLCERCAALKRKTREKNRPNDSVTRQDMTDRSYEGYCYKCGKPSKEGLNLNFQPYRLCEKCWQDAVKAAEKGRAAARLKYDFSGFWKNGFPIPRKDK